MSFPVSAADVIPLCTEHPAHTAECGGNPSTHKPWELVSALLPDEKDGGPVCEGYARESASKRNE